MMKKLLSIALLAGFLAIPATSNAVDMKGKWGLGYFHNDAPVGARFWVNERIGIDVGVGFEMTDVIFEGSKESASSFWLDAGVPIVVLPTERANFFVRPGLQFASLDDRIYGTGDLDETWSRVRISLTPGAEIFFGNNFSLEAGHGIAIDMMTPPDQVSDETFTTIETFDASVTYLGFHFYFK
jgi:hypothetical protein